MIEKEHISTSIQDAFVSALRRTKPQGGFIDKYPQYVREIEENLVPGVARAMFEPELSGGAGKELEWVDHEPPKFCAAFSSSALVVNTFARFKTDPPALSIGEHKEFSSIEFEKACPTGLQGTPPHLDLLALSGGAVLGVESKCTESLTRKEAKFAHSYETLVEEISDEHWKSVYRELKADPRAFQHLDAAQLVKHYLGLRKSYPQQRITLMYLFWEPLNASSYDVFRSHRKEIAQFSSAISGSSVAFQAQSYPELWRDWDRRSEPEWLGEHVANLRGRYCFEV